jgi:hypothetical protein
MTERKCMCPPSCPVNGWPECPISDTQQRLMQAAGGFPLALVPRLKTIDGATAAAKSHEPPGGTLEKGKR